MEEPISDQPKPIGIWDANLRNSSSQKNAKSSNSTIRLAPKKNWGIRHIIYSFVGFIGIQILVAVGLIFVLVASTPNPQTLLDSTKLSEGLATLLTNPVVLLVSQFSLYLTWLAFIAFVSRFRGLRSFAKDFWLKFRWYDAPLGLLIASALFLVINVLIPWYVDKFTNWNLAGADNASQLTGETGPWFFIISLGVVGIAGPFFEELYFRGFIMQGIIKHFRKGLGTTPTSRLGLNVYKNHFAIYNAYLKTKHWAYKYKYVIAVVVSSVLFGLMHFQGVETFGQIWVVFATGSIGLVLALIALRTRRLGLGIFIHIFFNSLGVLVPLILS